MSDWSTTLALTEESVTKHVGNRGGVYRLMCKKGEGRLVFYVGRSQDLGISLLELVHGLAQNPLLAQYLSTYPVEFRFFPTENAYERSQVEEAELAKWQPCCNLTHPPPATA